MISELNQDLAQMPLRNVLKVNHRYLPKEKMRANLPPFVTLSRQCVSAFGKNDSYLLLSEEEAFV